MWFAPSAGQMRHLLTPAHAFLRDDRGEDLTEYGLLAALIAIVAIMSVRGVGVEFNDFWTHIVGQLAAVL